VILLAAILPHPKHRVRARNLHITLFSVVKRVFIVSTYRAGVTLKKNLEKLRFANHLPP
jgi:hypothetical protein